MSEELHILPGKLIPDPIPSLDNVLIISNLEKSSVRLPLISRRFSDTKSILSEKAIETKLQQYDSLIGKPGTRNIFAAANRSEYITAQEDVTVAEGIYSFCVRTDFQTGMYWFKSRLQSTHDPPMTVESSEKRIWFQISTDPITVSDSEDKNKLDSESDHDQDESYQEEDQKLEKILGQAKIYAPDRVPSNQYFIRKIIENDRDYGLSGLREILRQRQQSSSKSPGSLRINKTIPIDQGMYEYEIFNKPPGTKLYFSSRLRYYVRTEKDNYVEEFEVPGSEKRLIII